MNTELCSDLIASIEKNGQIEPILVRHLEAGFEVIAGVRRWFACSQIPGQRVWAEVIDADDRTCVILMHAENADARDISDFERACSFKRQIASGLFKNQSDFGQALGLSQSSICKMLKAAALLDYDWFSALFEHYLKIPIRDAYKLSTLLKNPAFEKTIEAQAEQLLSEKKKFGSPDWVKFALKRLIQSVQADLGEDPLKPSILLVDDQKPLITAKKDLKGNLSFMIAPEAKILSWESIVELCAKAIRDYCTG